MVFPQSSGGFGEGIRNASVLAPFQTPIEVGGRTKTFNPNSGGWLPPGSTVVVKGRTIEGMVYLAPKSTLR